MTQRDGRFYAAQAAAAGMLITAVKFPPMNVSSLTSIVSQVELATVVMLMNHVPGAGFVGLLTSAFGIKTTLGEEKEQASGSRLNKLLLLGSTGLLCLGLFVDKRGFKVFSS
mmetsp:Transcript_69/g.91  ORF Transcript_69/g.91 Transcript_69/m.91 type:complete len:112 (-) Transcript_69:87-422(-)